MHLDCFENHLDARGLCPDIPVVQHLGVVVDGAAAPWPVDVEAAALDVRGVVLDGKGVGLEAPVAPQQATHDVSAPRPVQAKVAK